MCKIRLLKANEIDVRVARQTKDRVELLLYKDARCDMAILDETYGTFGWQREHLFKDGLCYCAVKIWDDEKQQWVTKEDVGVESNTEKEKGQASDAFKRACFNVGIGRELYSAPRIFVQLEQNEMYDGKISQFVKFYVGHIAYDDDRKISELTITDNRGRVRYDMNGGATHKPTPAAEPKQRKKITEATIDMKADVLCDYYYEKYRKNPNGFELLGAIRETHDIDDVTFERFKAIWLNYIQDKEL